MSLRLGTNVTAINASRHLNSHADDFSTRVERLSSGMRINSGADDGAGLALSEGMRSELLGMRQGVTNAELGISLLQLAEGALNEVASMLIRMRELAVTSANSTNNNSNRGGLTAEFNQLSAEIDRIAVSTTFNNKTLLTGFGNAVSQASNVSTALDGFSGITEIGISGAIAGTYVFTDADPQDNQLTLSVDFPDGTRAEQSLDLGSGMDRDSGVNLVATGTTLVANFDQLGVQLILAGPGVETGTTLKSTFNTGVAGDFVIVDPATNNVESVPIEDGQDLATIAINLNSAFKTFDLDASAIFDPGLDEILIETNGLTINGGGATLGMVAANAYRDGRLDGRTFVIEGSGGSMLQLGPNDNDNNRIPLNIGDMRATGTLLNLSGLSIANSKSALSTITRIDSAILAVSRQRGDLGAIQNRLQFTTRNLDNKMENLQAAESAIRDADIAIETAAFTRGQITTQAATAMVAQANALPQAALRLLE